MNRLVLFLACLTLFGCDNGTPAPPNFGSEDGTQIAQLIEDFNEAKSSPKKLGELFSTKLKLQANKYDGVMYQLVGKPTVTGAEATATIAVVSDADGSERGQATWKIKDAPLP
jgi:hypothetical protein